MVGAARLRARQVPVPHRPDHPGALAASWPSWRPWTTASRSRRPATPTCPLVAAHFFYYAGWADKLDHAGYGAEPAAARRRRPGHPLELPAADAGVEDRPGARDRQHGRPEARRDDPAVRAVLRGHLPPGGPAQGRRQHPSGLRRHGRRARRAPRRQQGRLHRLHRRRQGDRPHRSPAPTRRSPSNWAARAPTSSSTTPRSTRPSRASSTASSSTRARSAARARACWSRSRSRTSCWTPSSAGCPRCASATRWTRTPTSARSTPPSSSPGSPRSPRRARRRAPSAGPPACELPVLRLLVRPDAVHERHPGAHRSPATRSSARCCPC